MMSQRQIVALSTEQGLKAAKKHRKPFEIWSQAEIDIMPPFPFPQLGDYRPKGYTLVSHFQCDKTGEYDGFSLGIEETKARLKVGYAYAIIEEGEFQIVVGEFKPIGLALTPEEQVYIGE